MAPAFGIARNEQDRRVAKERPRLLQQGGAVEAGHDDVRDHHVDGPGVLLGQLEGLLAVGGLDDLIAALAQQAGGDAPHRGLVLDEQDAAGARQVARRLHLDLDRRDLGQFGLGRLGQEDAEHRPAFRRVRHVDVAAGLFDDAIDRSQTHPRALVHRLGGEEGFEDLVEDFGRDARTAVRHLDQGDGGGGGACPAEGARLDAGIVGQSR